MIACSFLAIFEISKVHRDLFATTDRHPPAQASPPAQHFTAALTLGEIHPVAASPGSFTATPTIRSNVKRRAVVPSESKPRSSTEPPTSAGQYGREQPERTVFYGEYDKRRYYGPHITGIQAA